MGIYKIYNFCLFWAFQRAHLDDATEKPFIISQQVSHPFYGHGIYLDLVGATVCKVP